MTTCSQNESCYNWHKRNHADDAPQFNAVLHHIGEAIWQLNRAMEDCREDENYDGVKRLLKHGVGFLYSLEEAYVQQ